MKDRNRFIKKKYWEALLIVSFFQLMGAPMYLYGWWKSRLSLIVKGEI